jgi:hypothetical protein
VSLLTQHGDNLLMSILLFLIVVTAMMVVVNPIQFVRVFLRHVLTDLRVFYLVVMPTHL